MKTNKQGSKKRSHFIVALLLATALAFGLFLLLNYSYRWGRIYPSLLAIIIGISAGRFQNPFILKVILLLALLRLLLLPIGGSILYDFLFVLLPLLSSYGLSYTKRPVLIGMFLLIFGVSYFGYNYMYEFRRLPIKLSQNKLAFQNTTRQLQFINSKTANHPYLLSTWFVGCKQCVEQEAHLKQWMVNNAEDSKIEIYAVEAVRRQRPSSTPAYIDRYHPHFTILRDTASFIEDSLHIQAAPALLLVRDGELFLLNQGFPKSTIDQWLMRQYWSGVMKYLKP